jgi:SHS2 domain-containing protein
MKNFEVLDISGDVGLKAYGENLKDAFINAAIGMYSLTTDLDMINEQKVIDVSAESSSVEGLLVSWLNELIFHFDAYGFVGKRIVINEFTPTFPSQGERQGGGEACRIKASVSGEEFNPERHESKLLIKAATYHRLKVEKKNNEWEIDVIFDI